MFCDYKKDRKRLANVIKSRMHQRKEFIMRDNIILKCTVCGEEQYITSKNKKNNPDRIEKKKYCPHCQKVQVFKEKK